MRGTIPVAVNIGAQVLKDFAVGDSIESRFKEIVKPENLSNGVFLCGSEDEEFRAAVGGLILSYPTGSPEQDRITHEMQSLNRISVMLEASRLGMSLNALDDEDKHEPIGLLRMWRERPKR